MQEMDWTPPFDFAPGEVERLDLIEAFICLREEIADPDIAPGEVTLEQYRVAANTVTMLFRMKPADVVLRLREFEVLWDLAGGDPEAFPYEIVTQEVLS